MQRHSWVTPPLFSDRSFNLKNTSTVYSGVQWSGLLEILNKMIALQAFQELVVMPSAGFMV